MSPLKKVEALKYLLNFKGTLQFQYSNASTFVEWTKAFTERCLHSKKVEALNYYLNFKGTLQFQYRNAFPFV